MCVSLGRSSYCFRLAILQKFLKIDITQYYLFIHSFNCHGLTESLIFLDYWLNILLKYFNGKCALCGSISCSMPRKTWKAIMQRILNSQCTIVIYIYYIWFQKRYDFITAMWALLQSNQIYSSRQILQWLWRVSMSRLFQRPRNIQSLYVASRHWCPSISWYIFWTE